ncbi:hypothetical protein AKJ57_06800, partial [candidate division MSBL1 archaeon SCGC-AAA259A05]
MKLEMEKSGTWKTCIGAISNLEGESNKFVSFWNGFRFLWLKSNSNIFKYFQRLSFRTPRKTLNQDL